MNRMALPAVALLLLLPVTVFASYRVEGNPDERPSLLASFGKSWGYENSVDETTNQVIEGSKWDIDGVRVNASFRLPLHRDLTTEIGYLYDGTEYSPTDIPAHTRLRAHFLNLSMRFYF